LERIHPPAVAALGRTANPAERDRLLARVRAYGFIDDYQGVRIAKDGTRFRHLARRGVDGGGRRRGARAGGAVPRVGARLRDC
jgi:hypothetical protein